MPAPKSPTTFECGVCLEDKQEISPRLIDEDPICAECVKEQLVPQFEAALQHEAQYPVKWGSTRLEAGDFKNELGPDFVRRFERLALEYNTPPPLRVYCKQQVYADTKAPKGGLVPGQVLALKQKQVEDAKKQGRAVVECGAMFTTVREDRDVPNSQFFAHGKPCWSCRGKSCPRCGKSVTLMTGLQHECAPQAVVDKGVEVEGGDQVRGRDFQTCPGKNCGTVVTLKSGCNYVICPSPSCPLWRFTQTGFCFLCGSTVPRPKSYWLKGGHFGPGRPCKLWSKFEEKEAQLWKEAQPEEKEGKSEQKKAQSEENKAQSEEKKTESEEKEVQSEEKKAQSEEKEAQSEEKEAQPEKKEPKRRIRMRVVSKDGSKTMPTSLLDKKSGLFK